MEFEITESATIDGMEVTITISVGKFEYFNTVQDFVLSNLKEHLDEDYKFIDTIDLKIESEISEKTFSDVIPKSYFNTYIDLTIETLEKDEEFELCATFLKIKKRYNSLTNEE